ncbi:hypothetical protein [Bartonella taylorii]|uniref:hypothetical protein n=1 Tax=Bartonella taylorii TaxID=33046 RepID=UPI001FEF169B|nr:hypothetical protein [Bartonella taylorii]
MLKGEEAFWDFRLESEVIQPTSSDYKDLLYILDFSTAHRFHVIPSVADSVTETEVLNSILLSVTSDAPKVTKSGVPIVIKSDDLSILPFSATPWSRVISSVGTANAESKILSRSSDARPNSAASNPMVIESVTPIATEIDASEKHSPALDGVVAASVAVAPKGDATLSNLDYVSLISKVFLASELSPHFKQNVRAVISQIPTYIFLPNTLFHTGWMDISNQNKQLEALRTVFHQSLKIDKNPAFFLRGQSGSYRYDSNLSALEYGYGGELDYNAMEVGALLKNIESVYSTTFLGLWGHMVNYPYNL